MTDDTSDAARGAFRLIYRSRDRLDTENRTAELSHLFTQARSKNERRRITGALLVSGDWFVQVLEGGEVEVRAVFGRIQQDPRNDAVELLSAAMVKERVFGHWSMAKVAADEHPDLPLIAAVGEVSPATGRGTTADQDGLLAELREAVSRTPAV